MESREPRRVSDAGEPSLAPASAYSRRNLVARVHPRPHDGNVERVICTSNQVESPPQLNWFDDRPAVLVSDVARGVPIPASGPPKCARTASTHPYRRTRLLLWPCRRSPGRPTSSTNQGHTSGSSCDSGSRSHETSSPREHSRATRSSRAPAPETRLTGNRKRRRPRCPVPRAPPRSGTSGRLPDHCGQ
jgi:hypothetical protein